LEVIGAVDVGDDSAGAADGGNEVGPEVVASEEMVLEAGAAEVGVDITRDDSGSEEGGPGGGSAARWCLEPELGVECSGVPTGCIASS
jgi:hypothetical protein